MNGDIPSNDCDVATISPGLHRELTRRGEGHRLAAVVNYFEQPSAVQRYAAARPFFHPIVREMIAARLGDSKPLGRAIDVACGTGLSTRILVGLANEIVGADVSPAMLGDAWQAEGTPRTIFPGEIHNTMPPASLSRSLRFALPLT